MNLQSSAKCTRCINAASAGTGTSNGTHVDMKGFDSVCFYFLLGAIGSTSPLGSVQVKAQGANAITSPESFSDLAGSKITYVDTADNKVAILEIAKPRQRYIRPVIVRSGGNSAIDGVIALQTMAGSEPVTHDSTVVSSELHLAPATGTA